MALHRNTGGGWRRKDGTRIIPGQVFTPTAEELILRAWKLVPVEGQGNPSPEHLADQEPTVESLEEPATVNVDQYHSGGGWYNLPGLGKVQGREAALQALTAGEEPDAES